MDAQNNGGVGEEMDERKWQKLWAAKALILVGGRRDLLGASLPSGEKVLAQNITSITGKLYLDYYHLTVKRVRIQRL